MCMVELPRRLHASSNASVCGECISGQCTDEADVSCLVGGVSSMLVRMSHALCACALSLYRFHDRAHRLVLLKRVLGKQDLTYSRTCAHVRASDSVVMSLALAGSEDFATISTAAISDAKFCGLVAEAMWQGVLCYMTKWQAECAVDCMSVVTLAGKLGGTLAFL